MRLMFLLLTLGGVGMSVSNGQDGPKKDLPAATKAADLLKKEKEDAAKKFRAEARRLSLDPQVQALFSDVLGFAGKNPYTWKATHAGSVFAKPDLFEHEWKEALARRPDVGPKNAKTVLVAVTEEVQKKYGCTPHVLFKHILTYQDTREKALLSAEETLKLVASLEGEDAKLDNAGIRKSDPRRRAIANGLTFLRSAAPDTKLPPAINREEEAKADMVK